MDMLFPAQLPGILVTNIVAILQETARRFLELLVTINQNSVQAENLRK
jgi:hypothetical protein